MDFSKVKPRLSKLRGQHFLTDKNIVAKIIAAAQLTGEDMVLEVGPGLGVMTREILPRVKKLIAVELDPLFVRQLRDSFPEVQPLGKLPEVEPPELEIVEGDILKLRIADLFTVIPAKAGIQSSPGHPAAQNGLDPRLRGGDKEYKLVSNLPYNITSAFLKKFLIEPPHPERIVVMLQKEVAERIAGVNYKPDGMLGIMCNLYADCSFVCRVSAGSFAPSPKVDSAVIMLKPYLEKDFSAKWGFEHGAAEDFLSFANRFFAQPRKKMTGALPKPQALKLRQALSSLEESPDSRPAVLSLAKWVELWKKLR